MRTCLPKWSLSARLQPRLADPSLSKVGRERWLLGGAPSETPGGIHVAAMEVIWGRFFSFLS